MAKVSLQKYWPRLLILGLTMTQLPVALKAGFAPKNRPYNALHYSIFMRLDAQNGSFKNDAEITFTPTEALTVLELDCEALDVLDVAWAQKQDDGNGARPELPELTFTQGTDEHLLLINFKKPLIPQAAYRLRISYAGQAGVHHDGFFKVKDPNHAQRLPLYFTHFEALSARKFFPANDEPYDKATTEITVEVDGRYQVLSNGRKLTDEIFKDEGGRAWRRSHWLQDKPHSTYLVNIAIGQFDKLQDEVLGVPLAIYTAPGKNEDVRFALDVVKKSMEFFRDFYNVAYPWAGYGMVGIPTFLWGGMENTSLTSMRESAMTLEHSSAQLQRFRIASVVSHELAHQWFGDDVTMKWWDDLWLNEAFASYMESLATERYWQNEYSLMAAVTSTWDQYFRQEDGPRSHPIVSNDLPSPEDAFDSTNYTKGEHVLRMLDFYIGREAFKKGLNAYLVTHAKSNASYKDFFAAMEAASGQNLEGFVASWLLARGYPIVNAVARWDEKTKKLTVNLKQRPNHAEDNTVYDVKIPVVFYTKADGSQHLSQIVSLKTKEMNFDLPLPNKPAWITWNPASVALIKLEGLGGNEDELRLQATRDRDPISRLAALFELAQPWINREAKTRGELSNVALETLREAIEKDPSPYVRGALMEKLADCKWLRLPGDLGSPVLGVAQAPAGFSKEDAIGKIYAQTRALILLGKLDYDPGHAYLTQLLNKTDLDLDFVAAGAEGRARVSDKEIFSVLEQALKLQAPRGYAFKKALLIAHGCVQNADSAQHLKRIVGGSDANNEILTGLLWRLQDNETLKNTAAGAEFFRYLVLDVAGFNNEMKARALGVLEESKDQSVAPALKEIAAKTPSERLRILAQKILDKNFATP